MTFSSQKYPGPPLIHYITGPTSGPVLLFLHGLGRFSEDYLPIATEMARSWEAVIPDFRGHGDSGRGDGGYFVRDYVRDTSELIRSRFSAPLVLYGHSLGAMVALAVAAAIPQRVLGIILEDPPFHTMGRRIHNTPWLPLFFGMQKVCRNGGNLEEMALALGDVSFPSRGGNGLTRLREVRTSEALAFGAKCLSKLDPAVFNAPIQGRWLEGYDERELFAAVQCPCLLLQGDPEAGGALTDEDATAAERIMPSCQRIRFEGVGHLVRTERPAEVGKAVAEFAGRLSQVKSSTHQRFARAADAARLGEQPIRKKNSQLDQPHV